MAGATKPRQVDLICDPEDRYLVRLLADALRLRGVQVVLKEPGQSPDSAIGLAVLTSAGPAAAQWPALLRGYNPGSLITFAEGEAAGRADAFVLAGWPGRSSDRALGELVRRLKTGAAIGYGQTAGSAERRVPGRAQASEPSPRRVLLGLGVAALLVALFSNLLQSPQADEAVTQSSPAMPTPVESPPAAGAAQLSRTTVTPASASEPSTAATTAAATTTATTATTGAAAAAGTSNVPSSATQTSRSQAAIETAKRSAQPSRRRLRSSVARFCGATTNAAAQAWWGVFDWQDQRQARTAPCVRQRLQEPALRRLLEQVR